MPHIYYRFGHDEDMSCSDTDGTEDSEVDPEVHNMDLDKIEPMPLEFYYDKRSIVNLMMDYLREYE